MFVSGKSQGIVGDGIVDWLAERDTDHLDRGAGSHHAHDVRAVHIEGAREATD